MRDDRSGSLITHREIREMPEAPLQHPWNANSEVYLKRLSKQAGLERVSLSLARVPPGRESFLLHRHECDEEFLFILSGRGRAEIGDRTIDVGAGDFMGFRAPDGPPHHLTNPFDEDLVYLMGGESSGFDIAHFPMLGRRLVFARSGMWSVDDADCKEMSFSQWEK